MRIRERSLCELQGFFQETETLHWRRLKLAAMSSGSELTRKFTTREEVRETRGRGRYEIMRGFLEARHEDVTAGRVWS